MGALDAQAGAAAGGRTASPLDRRTYSQPRMTVAGPAELTRIVSLLDFEPLARRAMDPGAYDYVAGGSWDEVNLGENVAASAEAHTPPRGCSSTSRGCAPPRRCWASRGVPLAIAPMAGAGMAHPDGDVAVARAAAAAGIPYTLSTFSTRSIEEVAAATRTPPAGSSSTSRTTRSARATSSGGRPRRDTGRSC